MDVSRHYCLTEVEAFPMSALTGRELEGYGYPLKDKFIISLTIVGEHSGSYSCGLDYELGMAGTDYILGDIPENAEALLELVEEKYQQVRKRMLDKPRMVNKWEYLPIRLLVLWEHQTTHYPATWDSADEYDTEVWPVCVVDWEKISFQIVQEHEASRTRDKDE